MEQKGPESIRQRIVAGLPVSSLFTLVDEITVSHVATQEKDDRPVNDHNCSNVCRSRWLEARRSDVNGRDERGRMRWKWPVESDLIHFAGTAPLKCIKITSRAASIKNTRGEHSRLLPLYDISVAFWFAPLPEASRLRCIRRVVKTGYMWQMKRAMYGTRRASRLFQEHMKGVLTEAGYAALKVCHQVYHCLETDSMAAIHDDDIIAEGEPEKLYRLDEVLKRLVVVKVLDRVGPRAAAHGQNLKRHIVYINAQGFEWLEVRSILLRSSETVPRWARSHRAPRVARTSGEAIQKCWTSWERWKESCISKIQASAFTCPVEDSTFSSV